MYISKLIFVNWANGAIIMTIVFGLVIAAIIGAVYYMSKKDKKMK
jgi:ABC-type multidrug transport system permease subunit